MNGKRFLYGRFSPLNIPEMDMPCIEDMRTGKSYAKFSDVCDLLNDLHDKVIDHGHEINKLKEENIILKKEKLELEERIRMMILIYGYPR